MKIGKLKFISILFAVVLLFVSIFALKYYFDESRYRFNEKPIALTDQWIEIAPHQTVTCNREFQHVLISVTTPYTVEPYGLGNPKIILQDGTTPVIECELVGVDGTLYPYRFAGILYLGEAIYPMFDEQGDLVQVARKRAYRAVRLRSSRPIMCAEVKLSCYSPPIE